MLQSWAYNLLTKGTLGLSDFYYPQTVQYFILASFPHSFYRFLLVLAIFLCSFGVFLFFLGSKKEMSSNFSELSGYLRMNRKKISKQAKIAALPKQVLIWSLLAPVIFIVLLFVEAKFEVPGIGNTMKMAFELNDLPLLYGSFACTFGFVLALNIFFLILKKILPHK